MFVTFMRSVRSNSRLTKVRGRFFISCNYSFVFSFVGINRLLMRSLCFAPIHHFTEAAMDSAVACWEWILAARPDVHIEVNLIFDFGIFFNFFDK